MVISTGDYSGIDFNVTEETIVAGGAWRGTNLVNLGAHPVGFTAGVPVHHLAVAGVRLQNAVDVPAWLSIPAYHLFGDPNPPPDVVSLAVDDVLAVVDSQLHTWWIATKNWIVTHPSADDVAYRDWFVTNQGSTLFYSGTFLPLIQRVVTEAAGSPDAWSTFRDWVLTNYTRDGFDGVF